MDEPDEREVLGPRAAALRDLASQRYDVEMAQRATRELLAMWPDSEATGPNTPVAWALWTAGVVAYTRCFGRDSRSTIPKGTLKRLNASDRATHSYVVKMRNMHMVHSENAYEDTRFGATIGPAPEYRLLGLRAVGAFAVLPPRSRVVRFELLAKAVGALFQLNWNEMEQSLAAELTSLTPEGRATLPVLQLNLASPATDPGVPRPR